MTIGCLVRNISTQCMCFILVFSHVLQEYNPARDSMCESRCQILSVTGTPIPPSLLPAYSFTSHTSQRSLYQSLIKCLNVENRKAGGYLQCFLDEMEDKVNISSSFYWMYIMPSKIFFSILYVCVCRSTSIACCFGKMYKSTRHCSAPRILVHALWR